MIRIPVLILALVLLASPAWADPTPIKIGDICSYTAGPSYQVPYRKGWQMAEDEINKAGGVLGRPLDIITRDDMGKPEEALRIADTLVNDEKVIMLTSSGFANVELAVGDFAKRNHVLYIPAAFNSDRFIWQEGSDYGYRIGGPPPYVYNAMLAERAAKEHKIRWANIGPNYEWGHTNWDAFRESLKKYQPDAQFVAEQWPKINGINAGQEIEAINRANPDAIYTSLFGNDLVQFIREGEKRGLFKDRLVVSLSGGMIQMLDLMKSETPQGWLVLAYPFTEIDTPVMKRFVHDYQARYNEPPDFPSAYGYIWVYFLKDLIEKTGTTDPEKLRQALKGFQFNTIFGPMKIRPQDNQSTMGAWIGKTAVVNGKGTVVDWNYIAPDAYFPPDADIARWRAGK